MLGLAAAFLAYFVGSFPTAYVIGKLVRGVDISRNGTGNIGAMNAFEVTGSKAIGIAVGVIDVAKGLLATYVTEHALGPTVALIAALFVVLGHNYSIFMRFKGGRGLASAAGALIVIQPICIPVYLAVYFLLRAVGLKLYISSVAGILLASIPLFAMKESNLVETILSASVLAAVLSKHVFPLKDELHNV